MGAESYTGRINRKLGKKLRIVEVAAGREKADLVLKNAVYVNVFSSELCHGDIAVAEGLIVGMGQYSGETEVDVSGRIVLPGFIDAHIHLESAMVSPREFAKAVLPHGTTTVVTDPHEIANVMGADGIEYMLQATEGLPVDVRFMLPSCVPATPMDESGAVLDYRTIDSFYDHPRVQGLAEMMNYDVYWLSREIRKRTGKTYKELLQAKRMNQAVYLLTSSRLSIADIIGSVGYDNTSYFYRKFRERYGVSPKEYRKGL